MAHFPQHNPAKFEFTRRESDEHRNRRLTHKRFLEQADAERQRSGFSGHWWTDQRYVDQVVPSNLMDPTTFDHFNYKYQLYARQPVQATPRCLSEATDQEPSLRYNIKRVAVDKPCDLGRSRCCENSRPIARPGSDSSLDFVPRLPPMSLGDKKSMIGKQQHATGSRGSWRCCDQSNQTTSEQMATTVNYDDTDCRPLYDTGSVASASCMTVSSTCNYGRSGDESSNNNNINIYNTNHDSDNNDNNNYLDENIKENIFDSICVSKNYEELNPGFQEHNINDSRIVSEDIVGEKDTMHTFKSHRNGLNQAHFIDRLDYSNVNTNNNCECCERCYDDNNHNTMNTNMTRSSLPNSFYQNNNSQPVQIPLEAYPVNGFSNVPCRQREETSGFICRPKNAWPAFPIDRCLSGVRLKENMASEQRNVICRRIFRCATENTPENACLDMKDPLVFCQLESRPAKHTPGYGTYKIIGGRQFKEPPERNIKDEMVLPEHLRKYNEYLKRCPDFSKGCYDKADSRYELILPSHIQSTIIPAMPNPFGYSRSYL